MPPYLRQPVRDGVVGGATFAGIGSGLFNLLEKLDFPLAFLVEQVGPGAGGKPGRHPLYQALARFKQQSLTNSVKVIQNMGGN